MGARALQLIAGAALVLGIYPRVAATALLLFLIPATLMAHAFWQSADTALYPVQLINFFKNECMEGGLIFVAAAKDQPILFPVAVHTSPLDETGCRDGVPVEFTMPHSSNLTTPRR